MYYNEKLINGLWHYKTMPIMEWKPMTIVQLTNKIAAQERELNKLRLSGVVKSFTAKEVANELKDCETIDDAIRYFEDMQWQYMFYNVKV